MRPSITVIALTALDHPHIAAIHGLHEEDGQHFLVMELVDGQTLADRLKRDRSPWFLRR